MVPNENPAKTATDYALGIDVGGTNTRIGLFTREGDLLASHSIKTSFLAERSSLDVINSEFGQIFAVSGLATTDITKIGLALPGMVNEQGELELAPNLDMDTSRYRKLLKAAFPNAKPCVINDSNAAALGDMWMGSGAELQVKNYVVVMVGTGIGAGLIINGQLYAGAHGAAGEIGHMCMEPEDGRPCKCGKTGCLERYASSSGITATAQEFFEQEQKNVELRKKMGILDSSYMEETRTAQEVFSNSRDVFEAAANGDRMANLAMHSFTEYLARGLSYASKTVNPELFVLGGGVMGSSDIFMDELQKRYRNYALSVCKETPIIISKIAHDCGIYGAAYFAFHSGE